MTDRLQEIRTFWNYQDLTQPVSIGRAFEDVEWCLDRIDAVTRERDEAVKKRNEWFSSVNGAQLIEEHSEKIVDLANELVEMQAERDAAIKREGRLREAILSTLESFTTGPMHMTCEECDVVDGHIEGCRMFDLAVALADEGRE